MGAVVLAVALGTIAGSGSAEKPGAKQEGTAQLLYQNEFVTLKQARLEPGETAAFAALLRGALYLFDAAALQVRARDAARHAAEPARENVLRLPRNDALTLHNTGESALEYLFIRSSVSPLIADPPGPSEYLIRTLYPPPVPGSQGVERVFDDDAFRIFEIELPPGGEMPAIFHPSGVYHALNTQQGEFVFADGQAEAYRRERGETWWMDAAEYAIRNTGDTSMHALFIGIKPAARYGEYEP